VWFGSAFISRTLLYTLVGAPPAHRKLHLIDRIRRPDSGHLEIETTIDDPGTYKQPWMKKMTANALVNDEIGEYIENNKDLQRLVGK
jgi:hypothetical protein